MATNNTSQMEGAGTGRPPLFNGTHYSYWKNRMRIFIESMEFDLWTIVEEGYTKPTITTEGITTEKPKSRWSIDEKNKYTLNSRAMNALFCGLSPEEYNKVSVCKTAKEIWDTLEVTNEGTSQVKDSKISTLMHKYEMFKMKPDETISEMYTRFTNIVNGLTSLGRETPTVEIVRKILQALPPKKWRPKVTAIEEAKDLKTLSVEQLIGSLITHEMVLTEEEDEKPKKGIALQATSKDEESEEDEEMALLTRRFKKFIKRKEVKRTDQGDRERKNNNREEERRCYNCDKVGHIAANCRVKQNKGKKAFAATWDDEDDELDISDSEVSEFGFIASIDNEQDDFVDADLIDDDIYTAFESLYNESKNISLKNSSLKKKIISLEEENSILINKISSLENDLKQKNIDLEKFNFSSKKLNTLLGNQRMFGDRSGIGYNTFLVPTLVKKRLSDHVR